MRHLMVFWFAFNVAFMMVMMYVMVLTGNSSEAKRMKEVTQLYVKKYGSILEDLHKEHLDMVG